MSHSKHLLSSILLPPAKRLHITRSEDGTRNIQPHISFDELSDELILLIFSYLSHTDLCSIQHTNQNWSRLSLDNQLWKALYINEYGRTRLRGARGFIGRGDGRQVRSLPGRAKVEIEGARDWKWMFRISSNWRTGRCTLERYDVQNPGCTLDQAADSEETHLLLTGNVAIAASSRPGSSPAIWLSCPTHAPYTIPCPSSRVSTAHITALAIDQSPPATAHHGRLICFLSTGEFTLFSIDHQTPSASSRLLAYVPSSRNSRLAPIIQAVYHHPLLVTLSESFRLSLYVIGRDTVTHTQTLSSFTSYPPSSLVLSSLSPDNYKLILAYAFPVYPSHWTVGATELIISEAKVVTSTRTARAIDIPFGWVDENTMRTVREQWGRKVARVADTQTDGKWVVLAPGQRLPSLTPDSGDEQDSSPPSGTTYTSSSMHTASGLQLYRLHLPAASSSSSPKLTFVRTLHGQIGPVSTLALSDGRCVSLGVNGSIWVWDLEGGTGAEVSAGVTRAGETREGAWEDVCMRLARGIRGSLVFDDRRIVSSTGSGVEVRRFDV